MDETSKQQRIYERLRQRSKTIGGSKVIFTKMNSGMKECLSKINDSKVQGRIDCNLSMLLDYIYMPFYEIDGCILMEGAITRKCAANLNKLFDSRSYLEYAANIMHSGDFVENPRKVRDKINFVKLGIVAIQMLKIKLLEAYPNDDFIIDLLYQTSIDRKAGIFRDTYIHFCKYREDEGVNWPEDIETISQPIGIIDTRELKRRY